MLVRLRRDDDSAWRITDARIDAQPAGQ
jgi:hypothetical protein